uniref:Pecanex-like protein n=1 Tax=Steinernema glaseri TaxID=37863 RepID=A0A1I7Y610_9BILA
VRSDGPRSKAQGLDTEANPKFSAFQFLAYTELCQRCYSTIFLFQPMIVDITTFLNPWFLLATSTSFRNSVKELIASLRGSTGFTKVHAATTT